MAEFQLSYKKGQLSINSLFQSAPNSTPQPSLHETIWFFPKGKYPITKMLFKSVAIAVMAAIGSVHAQGMNSTEMTSNIDRLTDLTRIANSVTRDVVYVNNPPSSRRQTIRILGAIATQATLDQDAMTGNACGSLTERDPISIAGRVNMDKRGSSDYTLAEQANVTDAYTIVRQVGFSQRLDAKLTFFASWSKSQRTSPMPAWKSTTPL